MRRFWFLILFIIISINFYVAESAENKRILTAQVLFGEGTTEEIDDYKVEAALMLAAKLAKGYDIITISERDSVAGILQDKGESPSARNIAKLTEADKIYFFTIKQLKNMLRVEIASTNRSGSNKKKGVGFALMHYMEGSDDNPISDPALLTALQRAFAQVEGKPGMFADAQGDFRVFPAQTLVVGGLMYDFEKDLPEWYIFTKKELTSYEVAEIIFDEAKDSDKYVVYDIASRDSIYALFNMHGIENFKAPTTYEIKALSDLQVDKYITGIMKRTPEGADIELHLCNIRGGQIEIIKSEMGHIDSDHLGKMRTEIRRLTRNLMELETNPE